MSTKEELVYIAKIAEQSERYEDMLDLMKKVVQLGQDLSIEERNLLSVAYKNSIGGRRSAWRVLESLEKKEEAKNQSKHVEFVREYKKKIETELVRICNDIVELLDQTLVPGAKSAEAQVFYYKMKGDYFRYISEVSVGDAYEKAKDSAFDAYTAASAKATSDLKTTHPIRLGLALNFSVFHYEVKKDPSKACSLAKEAFDLAIADIEHIDEDQYKDSTTIMQLIRDNLTLWTNEMEEGEGGSE